MADAVRKFADPTARADYSAFGEQSIILHLLDRHAAAGRTCENYYIDVGCNRPFTGSNPAWLYQRG
ncbi:hypothetical protein [Alienimonas sp. DA493]|uniref:hypothetical protein n=1 Tax=Alienimonas sp. DA493 TaxID=3373605 RepID=UPI003754C995